MKTGLFLQRSVSAARKRVREVRAQHPELHEQELADLLINEKARTSALAGCLTALPAVIPGLGTVVALATGLVADVTLLGSLLRRLVLELAVLYGRDPMTAEVQRELSWVLGAAAGVDGAGKRLAFFTAGQAARQGPVASLAGRSSLAFGLRAAQRSVFFRILPLLGIGVVGAMNYFFTRSMGRRMLAQFTNDDTPWDGRTVDTDFSVQG